FQPLATEDKTGLAQTTAATFSTQGNTTWACQLATFKATSGPPVAPSPPINVVATPSNAQVVLSWSASTGATSYNVKRSTTSGGPYTTIASPTTTGYTDGGLSNGTTYYYVVTAVNSGGESGNSTQVSATPQVGAPAAPTGVTATPGNAQ